VKKSIWMPLVTIAVAAAMLLGATIGLQTVGEAKAQSEHLRIMRTILPDSTDFVVEPYAGDDANIRSVHKADNGFVIELDFYVLERVCRKLRRDIDNNLPVLPISVNFSRTHIATEDLITRLGDCLRKYRIPPNLVEIEITESALIENEGYLADMISELHNIGLVVSMDDFGSGFSSLNLLKKLPFDVLKIDKNFFASDSATERERCIIENVVNMARALGINVVSEGVETAEQANFLRSINCDLAQGYLFSPPIDERSFERRYQNVID